MSMRIFDAHIDFDFPIQENQGYTPPSYVVNDGCLMKKQLIKYYIERSQLVFWQVKTVSVHRRRCFQ